MTITRQKLARWDMPMGGAVTERRLGGGYRCGFGGDSSQSSASTNTTVTTNTDKRLVVDGLSTGLSFDGSSGNSINLLDGGAVSGALNGVGNVVSAALNAVNDSTSNALAAMGITAKNAADSASAAAAASIAAASASADNVTKAATSMLTTQTAANANSFGTLLDAMLELDKGHQQTFAANLGLTRDLAASANSAYSDATATASGTKNLIMAGLVVVGLAAVMAFGKH